MLNKKAIEVKAVSVVKVVRPVESFVSVYSPVSGKKYRFMYKRFMKNVAKVLGFAIVGVVAAYIMLTAVLNAWDTEHEQRMQEQQRYLQSASNINPDLKGGE